MRKEMKPFEGPVKTDYDRWRVVMLALNRKDVAIPPLGGRGYRARLIALAEKHGVKIPPNPGPRTKKAAKPVKGSKEYKANRAAKERKRRAAKKAAAN